jgi:methylthioribose-1-phosphate isomerase
MAAAALGPLTSIKTSDDKIQIINQLLLPHTTEWLAIDTIEQAHDAIKTMKVSARPWLLHQHDM